MDIDEKQEIGHGNRLHGKTSNSSLRQIKYLQIIPSPYGSGMTEIDHAKIAKLSLATGLSAVRVKDLLKKRIKPHNRLLRQAWDKAMAQMGVK